MKFGAHVSISGGIDKAPARAYELGCECFQIFTRSPRGGQPSRMDDRIIDSFLNDCERFSMDRYYVHTPYFINLASKDRSLREKSVNLVREDLERSSRLRADYIMTHLGSSKGIGRDEAVKNVTESVKMILDSSDYYTKLLLENSAGQGNTVGDRFEELAEIIENVGHKDLFVCLDTAHMFAAGYDISDKESLEKSFGLIAETFGIENIKLLHGNDSKTDLGEKKDRHEHIGKGKIGTAGFEALLAFEQMKNVDMIVENPPDNVSKDIEKLKKIRDRS